MMVILIKFPNSNPVEVSGFRSQPVMRFCVEARYHEPRHQEIIRLRKGKKGVIRTACQAGAVLQQELEKEGRTSLISKKSNLKPRWYKNFRNPRSQNPKGQPEDSQGYRMLTTPGTANRALAFVSEYSSTPPIAMAVPATVSSLRSRSSLRLYAQSRMTFPVRHVRIYM